MRVSPLVRLLSTSTLFSLAMCLSALAPTSASAQCTPDWDPSLGVPGAVGTVRSLATFQGQLYAGGEFTSIGGVPISTGLARFDGSTWSEVGTGVLDGGTVNAMVVGDLGAGPRLYLGGNFFGLGTSFIALVAEFDGTSFQSMNGGCEGFSVSDLAVFDPGTGPRVYACGDFTTAGGEFAEGVAGFDGTNWFPIGNGNVNGAILSLHTHQFFGEPGPSLYLGGLFSSISNMGGNNIARYDGTTISPLDLGVDGVVRAIETHFEALWVGGDFANAGTVFSPLLVRWDGFLWNNPLVMTTPPSGSVRALEDTVVDGTPRLAIGGSFTGFGTASSTNIAFFEFGLYVNAGTGTDLPVLALHDVPNAGGAVAGGLYAGGEFTMAGGAPATRIARYETCPPFAAITFRRGDANGDGGLNIADAVAALGILFGGAPPAPCEETLDINDDGSTNIADAIFLLGALFVPGQPQPPEPVSACGPDTDGDAIPCDLPALGC